MGKKKYGFGIVGCGTIANWHAEAILRLDEAKLAGVSDAFPEGGEAFAGKYNTHFFKSFDEMLANQEIKIISICTPSGMHAPLAEKAAMAGKHVIVEKPMALTLAEADKVICACEAAGVKLAVISQLRFSKAARLMKAALENKVLGKLIMGDIYMKYYRSQEYYDKGGWRGTWKMDGGGALMNQGIHGVDLLQYMMGPVKSVFAHTRTLARKIEVEDTVSAVLEFKSGALGVIQAATSVYPGAPRRLEINGENGTIVMEEDSIIQWETAGSGIPEGLQPGKTTSGAASNPTAISLDGHVEQIRDMIEAVKTGRKPFVDQYEGRKPIAIIMAVYESSRKGKPVELEETV